MDIRSLCKICDSFIADAGTFDLSDYASVARKYPDNFYAVTGSRLKTFWERVRKNNKTRSSEAELPPFEVNGGRVYVRYDGDKIVVSVNGKISASVKSGPSVVEKVIQQLAESEKNGTFTLNRSDKPASKDANELSPDSLEKNGLRFPGSVYKALMKTPEGKTQKIMKRNRKSRKSLTSEEYEYLVNNENLDESKYVRGEDGMYYRSDIHIYFLDKPKEKSIKSVSGPLKYNDWFMEQDPEYAKFFSKASTSGGEWIVKYNGRYYKIYGEYLEKESMA